MIVRLIILFILLVHALSFIVLKPTTQRKIYPGWEYIEALMWKNKFCNWLLLHLRGKEKYEEAHQEWVKNSKYGDV